MPNNRLDQDFSVNPSHLMNEVYVRRVFLSHDRRNTALVSHAPVLFIVLHSPEAVSAAMT